MVLFATTPSPDPSDGPPDDGELADAELADALREEEPAPPTTTGEADEELADFFVAERADQAAAGEPSFAELPQVTPVRPWLPSRETFPPPEPIGRRRIGPGFFAVIVLLLVGAALAFYFFRPVPPADNDLLALAAEQAAGVRLAVETPDPAEAETFIVGEFGWPITVPELNGATLEGAGIAEIVSDVQMPVLRYRAANGAPITVYVYDYALLDAAGEALALPPAVYTRLADDEARDVRRLDDYYLVSWRRRAAIYTAVTTAEPAFVSGLQTGP
ncbi:MAG TPA: hypothetical protein VD962_04700 [Rubricoccaceae bacterium]|nr:hypothetical protein [Rubricoccaceae bacterium]